MRLVLRLFSFEAAIAGTLFGCAGRLDLPWFWAVMGLHATHMGLAALMMDPGLRKERSHPGAGGKDQWLRLLAGPLILAHLAVAGLDVGRFQWSGPLPFGVQLASLVGYTAALQWLISAMRVNRFFSPVVRIQVERGHHVITTGPYRYVRHPGYLGGLVAVICSGPALGSWWSMLPMAGFAFLFIRRLLVEDRYLHEHLEGYAQYAQKVRYRLLPRVW